MRYVRLSILGAMIVILLASCAQITKQLSITFAGSGSGTITLDPASKTGIGSVTKNAVLEYPGNTKVTLTATPDTGSAISSQASTFVGWGGACSGATGDSCTITMDDAKAVTVTFDQLPPPPPPPPATFDLNLTIDGTGGGTVTLTPPGENCTTSCTKTYNDGTVVTLTVTPNADSDFSGWGGACSGATGSSCAVTMDKVQNATATFTKKTFTLTLGFETGLGDGAVTSSPAGINCTTLGGDCSEVYDVNTVVQLTATPDGTSEFARWGGDCAGETTNVCTITMGAARNVTAKFQLLTPVTVMTSIKATPDGKTTDDGEEFLQTPVGAAPEFVQGTVATHTRAIDFTFDFSSELVIGLRFENLSIPPGAVITGAQIQFTSFTGAAGPGDAGPLSLTIKGQSDTNPTTFKNATENPAVRNDITGRPATSASVDWDSIPQWFTTDGAGPNQLTPDLSSIVQEIIDLSGWSSSSNALVFIISKKTGTGIRRAADRRFADEQADPTLVAKITITYK